MTENEFEDLIHDILVEVAQHKLPVIHAKENIMRSMKQHFNYKPDLQAYVEHILQPGANHDQAIRKGWSEENLWTTAVLFIDTEYPRGGDLDNIRRHFFNALKYKKPNEKNIGNRSALSDFELAETLVKNFGQKRE